MIECVFAFLSHSEVLFSSTESRNDLWTCYLKYDEGMCVV